MLPKVILLLNADVTLRIGHFGFKAGGPFPTIYNTGESGMPGVFQVYGSV